MFDEMVFDTAAGVGENVLPIDDAAADFGHVSPFPYLEWQWSFGAFEELLHVLC